MSEATQQPGTNVAPMPNRAQFKPLSQVRSIGEALKHPEIVARFKDAVPKHMSPERLLRVCALAVAKTPKLAECDMMSLLGAMLGLAVLGLEPNTPLGLAHLVPFDKREKVNGKWQVVGTEVQVIIGYQGYIDLARRTGSLVSIHADVVYDGDEFSFEYGSNSHLRHIPRGGRKGRKPLWAYCHAKLTDGQAFGVLPYEDVLAIRDGSQGYQAALRFKDQYPQSWAKNPWVAHEHPMACKTMVRQLQKFLPKSIELANAAALDAMSETGGVNLKSLATAPTTELMDMALLTTDGTDLYGSSFEDHREPVHTEQHQQKPAETQQQTTTAPHQQQRAPQTQARQQTDGGPPDDRWGPPAGEKAAPPLSSGAEGAPSHAQATTFHAWAVDEIGEAVEDENGPFVFHDPVKFAQWFVERWQASTNREALTENNADSLADARKFPAAADILIAASGETKSWIVAMPTNQSGSPHLGGYIGAVNASLARVSSLEDAKDWDADNVATYSKLPRATRTAVEVALSRRQGEIQAAISAAATPTQSDAPKANDQQKPDPDQEWVERVFVGDYLLPAKTTHDLAAIEANALVKARLDRYSRERPELADEMRRLAKERAEELRG